MNDDKPHVSRQKALKAAWMAFGSGIVMGTWTAFILGLLVGCVLGIIGTKVETRIESYSPNDVSWSYKCGMLRALRDAQHLGATDDETEAFCTRLQQANWDDKSKHYAACLDAVGWGNYLSADRTQDDQQKCWRELWR